MTSICSTFYKLINQLLDIQLYFEYFEFLTIHNNYYCNYAYICLIFFPVKKNVTYYCYFLHLNFVIIGCFKICIHYNQILVFDRKYSVWYIMFFLEKCEISKVVEDLRVCLFSEVQKLDLIVSMKIVCKEFLKPLTLYFQKCNLSALKLYLS